MEMARLFQDSLKALPIMWGWKLAMQQTTGVSQGMVVIGTKDTMSLLAS